MQPKLKRKKWSKRSGGTLTASYEAVPKAEFFEEQRMGKHSGSFGALESKAPKECKEKCDSNSIPGGAHLFLYIRGPFEFHTKTYCVNFAQKPSRGFC
jgi:hypothetical protein